MNAVTRAWAIGLLCGALAGLCAAPASARLRPEDPEYQDLHAYEQEVMARIEANKSAARRGAKPMAIPDIFGQGSVLNVGNFVMKVTNNGLVGNPFTNISADPSGQWPGTSSIEYLNFVGLAMGAVNPFASDPTAVRRVSSVTEWRPATLDPEDRMYRGYDGIVNGVRFINDDAPDNDPLTGDPRFDEDFLDGRDNDGDGKIDEDFAAIGQQMFTCVIRDDTQAAIAAAAAERHVPLGVECHQTAWAYSIPGFTDFNIVNWKFFNRSGHELDSVVVGLRVDMDCGPADKSNYFSDDFDAPQYPYGRFVVLTKETDLRLQPKSDRVDVGDVNSDSSLCPRFVVTVQGFSVVDDDGDEFKTPGSPHVLLIDHTVDPTGATGPARVGFRAFRSFTGGTPYIQGGNPTIDQQRFEMMTSTENISNDPSAPAQKGFISSVPGDQKGDYAQWASMGPWLHWAPNATLECTIAIGVRLGDQRLVNAYSAEYQAAASLYKVDPDGTEIWAVTSGQELIAKYPALDNALAAQIAFEGSYEVKAGWPTLPDFHGREAAVKAPTGQIITVQGCEAHDPAPRFVNDRTFQYFDFDCDYCTGAYSRAKGGLFHRTWLAESPPPSPNTNLTTVYNYSDNPDRRVAPAGDGSITVAWDNLSELASDPKTGWMDFKGYKIWKVSNWTRPVGSGGPAEDDWTLLAEYRQFNGGPTNRRRIVVAPGDTVLQCPNVYIPQVGDSVRICLDRGDLFDLQSGSVIKPDPSILCVGYPNCQADSGFAIGTAAPAPKIGRIKYPVGRYRYVDNSVKNGFIYFYAVTAFDSTGQGNGKTELNGRRSAVEAEGIVPQISANLDRQVWVVPNPYRGLKAIQDRPSAWDLTPNASDPTGTHIDFMGLPSGKWSIKIFTLSGDWVASINSDDPVNASTRNSTIIDSQGVAHQNVNRQQDTPNDGQARWNLISRNGQDVVSGIYLFTVESNKGTQRGKFVVIR